MFTLRINGHTVEFPNGHDAVKAVQEHARAEGISKMELVDEETGEVVHDISSLEAGHVYECRKGIVAG